ncbi:MAG TPA: glutathione S-transferase N-terminal domain-containing protein [Nannocystaceae bacterium]|nr:glutathione S-transferase N-terminal domain-containing protein [Nannocystaceae bacterium]
MTPQLWSLPYSPWSEKAKWALEDSGVRYQKQRYEPLIGEAALRWRTGKWRGKVSVPVLRTDEGWLTDSFEIARWASTQAPGSTLMRELDRVREYNELSERGLAAGRARSLQRLLGHRDGLRDMLPPKMRPVLGPLGIPLAAFGVRRTLRKYAATVGGDAERELTDVLDRLRADLDASKSATHGVAHLLDGFSYADIAMAQVLAFVDPPTTHLRLGEGARATFHDPEVAPRYVDLLAWRDRLYRELRDRKPS